MTESEDVAVGVSRSSVPGVEVVPLGTIYATYGDAVYGLAHRVTRSREGAEEVTQDVFLHLWTHDGEFDPSLGTLRNWLMMVCHGRAVSWVRREAAQNDRKELAARTELGDTWKVGVRDNVEMSVIARRDAVAVHAALDWLSPAHRVALVLVYFGGFTHREVAELLGIPVGTAKTRVRDGLRQLSGGARRELAQRVVLREDPDPTGAATG